MTSRESELDNSVRFDMYVKTPSVWFYEAVGLLRAAFVLWEKFSEEFEKMMKSRVGEMTRDQMTDWNTQRFMQCYMMIAGLAIENLVKAVLVAKENIHFTKGRLPKELESHDLAKLLCRASVQLSEGETRLVARAADAIVWKGRYAIPRLADKIPSEGFAHISSHPRDVVALFRKMVAELPSDVLATDCVPNVRPYLDLLDHECPDWRTSAE